VKRNIVLSLTAQELDTWAHEKYADLKGYVLSEFSANEEDDSLELCFSEKEGDK